MKLFGANGTDILFPFLLVFDEEYSLLRVFFINYVQQVVRTRDRVSSTGYPLQE